MFAAIDPRSMAVIGWACLLGALVFVGWFMLAVVVSLRSIERHLRTARPAPDGRVNPWRD